MVRVRPAIHMYLAFCAAAQLTAGTASARPRLPGIPKAPSPVNSATDVSTSPQLSWGSRLATTYDVYLGTTAPLPRVATRQPAATFTPSAPLANGTTYYWKIVAYNTDGSTSGSQW